MVGDGVAIITVAVGAGGTAVAVGVANETTVIAVAVGAGGTAVGVGVAIDDTGVAVAVVGVGAATIAVGVAVGASGTAVAVGAGCALTENSPISRSTRTVCLPIFSLLVVNVTTPVSPASNVTT